MRKRFSGKGNMTLFSEWPYQWVDIPNDLIGQIAGLPRLPEWIDETWHPDDLGGILEYIKTAPVYTYTLTPKEIPCVKCGAMLDGISMWHLDNFWLWTHTTLHYVESHSVRLPDRMVAHIRNRMYRPPSEEECDLREAERIFDQYLSIVIKST